MRFLSILLACFLAYGCTYSHQREFLAQPAPELSEAETQVIFESFQRYLEAKGLTPLPHSAGPNVVVYRIGGSRAGFSLRQDWEEIMELTYEGGTTFKLSLLRIVHHSGADFTDDYVQRFVEKSEAFIREASSKPVRVTLVQKNGI